MRGLRAPLLALLAVGLGLPVVPARAQDALDKARAQYEMGIKLFDAGQNEQALIEFKEAYATKPRPAALFMMAQCEYTLGQLHPALEHYQRYVRENPEGQNAELARYRIEAIGKRQSLLYITTDPPEVDVRIQPEPGTAGNPVTGRAPSTFAVRHGRHRITLSKAGYVTKEVSQEVDIAESKPLLFTLEPIRARLEIETDPPDATLYINGNRARNPYRQSVAPGQYEIFAEAKDRAPRTEQLTLAPAQHRSLTGPQRFTLANRQRSGRPELWVASSIIGGLMGGAAVGAAIGPSIDDSSSRVSTWSFVTGGVTAGVIGGMLGASALVPRDIPDNRALFILGGMWMGVTEGALTGLVINQAMATESGSGRQLRAAFLGAVPGLVLGTGAGVLLSPRAPTYGRVALIQSAAAGGALAGWLTAMALQWHPFALYKVDGTGRVSGGKQHTLDHALPALIGLNAGLAAGWLGAALPRSSNLTWERVALIDLSTTAGAVAAAIGGCALQSSCIDVDRASDGARARVAGLALGGAALGLVGGVLATRHLDGGTALVSPRPSVQVAITPVARPDGTTLPTVGLAGRF